MMFILWRMNVCCGGRARRWRQSKCRMSGAFRQRRAGASSSDRTGAGVLEIKGNEVVPLLSMDQLGGANLLSIECEPDGGYFAATLSGLVRWKDGRLTKLGAESNAYIARHIITDLARLPDGSFAVGTHTGAGVLVAPSSPPSGCWARSRDSRAIPFPGCLRIAGARSG